MSGEGGEQFAKAWEGGEGGDGKGPIMRILDSPTGRD